MTAAYQSRCCATSDDCLQKALLAVKSYGPPVNLFVASGLNVCLDHVD